MRKPLMKHKDEHAGCCGGKGHSHNTKVKTNHVHSFVNGRCSCGLQKEEYNHEVEGSSAVDCNCDSSENNCCSMEEESDDEDPHSISFVSNRESTHLKKKLKFCSSKDHHKIKYIRDIPENQDSIKHKKINSSRKIINNQLKSVPVEKNIIEYKLQGLHCASCATKIERQVVKLDTVRTASLNFNLSTLKIDLDGNLENTEKKIKKIIKDLEPDVKLIKVDEIKADVITKKSKFNPLIGRILFSSLLVIMGFVFKNYSWSVFIFISAYLMVGTDIILRSFKNILRKELFDENFLMSLATFAAIYVGEYPEAVMVMLLYQIGEYFQGKAVESSRKSIADLMDIRPDYANLEIKDQIQKVSPEKINIGDVILVKPGEKVPLDGFVVSGQAYFDTKALTGETYPRDLSENDEITSGYINIDGVVRIKVTKTFKESTVSKILDLVQNASGKKAKTELRITKFAKYYTPIVVFIAVLISTLPPILFENASFEEWLIRGATFLVVSCPCALVISVPMSYFAGLGAASKKGILVKGGNYLEALSQANKIVFDKTGTLTEGNFKVDEIIVEIDKYKTDEILKIAAFLESYSTHPIGKSIVAEYGREIDQSIISNYKEVRGKGIKAQINGEVIFIGNRGFLKDNNIKTREVEKNGTIVYVAIENICIGSLVIKDTIKETARDTIDGLKKLEFENIVMLTGDRKTTAKETASILDITDYKYELLPDQKVFELEKYINTSNNGSLLFVGDGINDAPVLARADVGIAMGGVGSDAAIEAADVVLMNDDPIKIIEGIKIAKYTKNIVNQNIFMALGIKAIIMGFAVFGLAPMWLAVLGDVGVSILAVFNAMRILKFK